MSTAPTPALANLCQTHGIIWRYEDGAGLQRTATAQTCEALLHAMGADEDGNIPTTRVVEANTAFQLTAPGSWHITLEDGSEKTGAGNTLIELPIGIHNFDINGTVTTIISAPKQLPLPARGWGIIVPIYGLNARDGGVGTYGDLGNLAAICAENGASFLGLNPIHAGFPTDDQAYSPYVPSSRQHLNISHIDVGKLQIDTPSELIDYQAHSTHQSNALRAKFQQQYDDLGTNKKFSVFKQTGGKSLEIFAAHQALSEVHGPYWLDWPIQFQDSNSTSVDTFARANINSITFNMWLQWQAARELSSAQTAAQTAGMSHGLYLDLAVGTHKYGAETWANSQTFARSVSIGAPPDAFSASGQNWNLAPLNPLELKRQQFSPFVKTLRAQLDYAGMLRIDHALGMERSFWIPDGVKSDAGNDGAYVAMPREALFALLRIEAGRTDAVIIGEDLGNVPDGLRDEMANSGILGCRVAMFERKWKSDQSFIDASDYTVPALASLSTHDLPTMLGWAAGSDINWRENLGETTLEDAALQRSQRKADIADFKLMLNDTQPVIVAAHQFLARTSSVLVAVQIEDILELTEQPNLPGTIFDHPNWQRTLPISVDEIATLPMLSTVASDMRKQKRAPHD